MVRNTNWPTIERTDPLGSMLSGFQEGRDYGRQLKFDHDAPDAFGAYLDSIYGGGSPTGGTAPASLDLASLEAKRRGGSATGAPPAVGDIAADYFTSVRNAESSGDPNAKNPNSSATGLYQFIEPTWNGLMASHPELGLTPDGRNDPVQQEKAMRAFTADNARTLQGAGLGVDPGSLYAAHFLGAGGATKVLQGDPNSPVSAYVDPSVIKANPQLAGMTVGQFRDWAASKGGNGSGGYAAPMANTGIPSAGARTLPPREVMMKLFQNPETRPLAIEAIKTAQAGGGTGAGKMTDDMTEYMFALQQGFKGSFMDWQATKTAKAPDAIDFGDIASFRKEVQGLPSYKNYAQALPIYNSMVETADRDTRASDLNLVYGLGKIMDPTSVVREGEMFMVQGINTLPEKLIEGVNSLLTGSSTLSPETRKTILEEAYGRMKGYQNAFDNDATSYRGIAGRYNVNPDDILPNFQPVSPYVPPPPPGTKGANGAVAPAGEKTPPVPADFPDPSLWEFLTPEERALWPN